MTSSMVRKPRSHSLPLLEGPSMPAREVLSLLFSRGAVPLTQDNWLPGQPVLFVFEDWFNVSDFKNLIRIRKPNIARLDNPSEWRQGIMRSEGQVDYYAIDPESKKLILVKTSMHAPHGKEFAVAMKYLFHAIDELFPKGPPVLFK
jgi:hypothetical protein